MCVVRLVNLREVVHDRLPCGLVVAWARWVEAGIAHGGGGGEGVVLFASSEKVKVTSENEEAVLGIRLYMASILSDSAFDTEYLRGRKTKIVNIPVYPTESFTGRGDAQYSPRYKMAQRKVIL